MICLVFKVINLLVLSDSFKRFNSFLKVRSQSLCSQILSHLPLSAVGAMEQVCRHLRTVIIHARYLIIAMVSLIILSDHFDHFITDFII